MHTCTPGHGRNKTPSVIFDWPNICKIRWKTIFVVFFLDGIGKVRCCLIDFDAAGFNNLRGFSTQWARRKLVRVRFGRLGWDDHKKSHSMHRCISMHFPHRFESETSTKIAWTTTHHLKIFSLLGLCIPPYPPVLTVEFSKVGRAIGYIRPWSHARLNRATLVPHRTLLPSFGLHILLWMGLFNSKICKEMYANPIGLSANWWYSKVMMTVYDSVTKETLDHQPSHLSSNFGVSLRRVFVTTNWGWQAMTSNDLIDSWVMYSAPSWEWRSSRTLGFCEIKRVVDMCSCHKCYLYTI